MRHHVAKIALLTFHQSRCGDWFYAPIALSHARCLPTPPGLLFSLLLLIQITGNERLVSEPDFSGTGTD